MRRLAMLLLVACAGKAGVGGPAPRGALRKTGPCEPCPGDPPRNGSLKVRVTISMTSIPVWFVTVRVGDVEGEVDADGEVRLEHVPVGAQEVVVGDTEVYLVRIPAGGAETLDATVPATIFLREPPPRRPPAQCDCGEPLPPGVKVEVSPCRSPPPEAEVPTGKLRVRVRDGETLQPEKGSWVVVSVGPVKEFTNDDGEAVLEELPVGEQDVVIRHEAGWSTVRRAVIAEDQETVLDALLDHVDEAPPPPPPPAPPVPGPDGWICPYGRRP